MIMQNKERRINILALAAALICGLVVIITLNIPSNVGLANNGDFTRIIYQNGISYIDDNTNLYEKYVPEYKMNLSGGRMLRRTYYFFMPDYSTYDYISSQSLVIQISKVLNLASNMLTGNSYDSYNLFWLGIIYAVIFTLSLYLIMKFMYKRFGMGVFIFSWLVCLFVFCDQGYTLYFNSFFGEAVQYTSTFLVIGLYLHLMDNPRKTLFSYFVYYAAVIIMGTSKYAYAPVGILFAALPFFCGWLNAVSKIYIYTIASAAVIWLVVFIVFLTPSWIEKDTNFNSVFAGVLKYSNTPENDLEELGLNPSFAALKGWESYKSGYPIDVKSDSFKNEFYQNVSKTKILLFYLKHPSRFIHAMNYSAEHTKYIRPRYLGNISNPSVPREQSYRFSVWESLRVRLNIHKLWVIAAFCAAAFIVCIHEIRRNYKNNKSNICLCFLLLAILFSAAFNFAIPYISNGICDIAKHLFGFIYLYDIVLFVILGYVFIKIKEEKVV